MNTAETIENKPAENIVPTPTPEEVLVRPEPPRRLGSIALRPQATIFRENEVYYSD
jgi:hypothetical protein